MSQQQSINRKWLNDTLKMASRRGAYFTGSTPREIALSIVVTNDMHPCYVGKLDQLITKLIERKAYAIINAQLVRSDNVTAGKLKRASTKKRRMTARRNQRQTRHRGRQLAVNWHAEQLA